MKGVILAGGFGTRLLPLTGVTNKHLLPIYDRPMIFYPIATLRKSGIDEILIVSESSHLELFSNFLKNGVDHQVSLTYAPQIGAGGIAEALKKARDFSKGDSIAVILGDNIFDDNFEKDVNEFKIGAKIFLKEVSDLKRFGVPVFEKGEIVKVEEKPENPKSRYAVTGFYLFDKVVFEIISELKPSGRGELEITDALNKYAEIKKLNYGNISGFWADAGTFGSLLEASLWAAKGNIHRDVHGD
ncbi:MAG: NTP transferase domain-containing protein [Candidatus Liptonbacteria bacterium]|nr:NTP transferase domain-containing protein [Candidatus Liptonbacteria bacterium]